MRCRKTAVPVTERKQAEGYAGSCVEGFEEEYFWTRSGLRMQAVEEGRTELGAAAGLCGDTR